MTDLFVIVACIICFVAVNITITFMPNSWIELLRRSPLGSWYAGPLILLIGLVVLPGYLTWLESRKSGLPFRLHLESYLEYLGARNWRERRIATLKLIKNEKELEDNK
jgi:hypothetical protein